MREDGRGCRRAALVCLVALSASSAAVLALAAPSARAGLPPCPAQKQLEARGATAAEVSSPAAMSTGTFPLAGNLTVPDEQCSYQGALGLLLVFWHLTPRQQKIAQAHLQYECKATGKKCAVFVSEGSSISSSVDAATGKTKNTTEKTLEVIVTSGKVEGEATAKNPPKSVKPCDLLATALYSFLGVEFQQGGTLLDELRCVP